MKPPDILNSKIKKLRIELPHYSFSHSSSGDSPHAFIGRERTREKLKKIIEDSPDEPGVYLVAGNRGVGKTSLVSWVINETSLRDKTRFAENFRFALLLFLVVAIVQVITQFCINELSIYKMNLIIFWAVIFAFSFMLQCCYNSYRRKFSKQKYGFFKKILDCVKSAIKEMSHFINPYNPYGRTQYLLKIISAAGLTQLVSKIFCITPVIPFLVYLVIVTGYNAFRFIRKKRNKIKQKNKKEELLESDTSYLIKIKNLLLIPIWNYIKNHNRLYIRINFGHKLKDERDILRLITRTLSTEFNKYRRSFRRMLFWRIMAIIFLLFSASSFSSLVRSITNIEYIEIFSNMDSKIQASARADETAVAEMMAEAKIKTKKIANPLHKLNFIVSKISNKIIIILQYLCDRIINVNKNWSKKIIDINFLQDFPFWLTFFMMYLCGILLFRLAWITHMFVTHGIITKQLKKLNNDITYSTELEKSIGINSEKPSPIIGLKSKKSRNIADAREIEKELQDILSDMQRIPVIMCRPNVVIVFDELDKVEPSYAGSEKETPQTKASLFSIDAARERQTEILKILSNMKYFLSSARAKFIFIAGREMYDIHLADVSERNNYIGSIFNASIIVPSFLTDHHTGKETLPQESSIALLPEEFVCRRLLPHDYKVDAYNLENYRIYLEEVIFNKNTQKEKIQKIIAVLQQFIIYLAHVSKGAPKKMIQLFESFVDIGYGRDNEKNTLLIQQFHGSRHFLSFNYYKQYTIGIIAYLITPIYYRLAESNIKEHSDKLIVSSLRFIDFLFKFHKNAFSWKHLDMSPEMLEVNRAPELKSIVVDLLNYLTQVHINRSNFSLSEYKFDSLIANEIFAMAKTDEVFSALFSFSLDEMLPLRLHYQNLLEKTRKEYHDVKKSGKNKVKYIDAVSSLQIVLGDLHYYDDQLEEAEAYYKSSVHGLREKENDREGMTLEKLYVYVRNMLRLGIIYEKRKQYDFAYMTYEEICKRIICERYFSGNNYMSVNKIAYEGLKMLYLPFIAKLQILELGHMGGITSSYLNQLNNDINNLTPDKINEEIKSLKAEFYSRVADILYYKNSDLNDNKCKEYTKNTSCSACCYYFKALSTLLDKTNLNKPDLIKPDKETVKALLKETMTQIKENYNMKFNTILARILSDWGNVFFSCDSNNTNSCHGCNSTSKDFLNDFLDNCINYLKSEKEIKKLFLSGIDKLDNKKDIAFAMYTISSEAYRKANLYKRSSYQLYKMLCLFKDYEINKFEESKEYIKQLSKMAIHYLLYANDDLNVLELNKRKKDFGRQPIKKKIPLQSLLLDSEIIRIKILVKDLKLKSVDTSKDLKKYYKMRITSPYKINYSIVGRIYQLWLKTKVNYKTYQKLLEKANIYTREDKDFILTKEYYEKIIENEDCEWFINEVFDEKYDVIQILENLIAETIYCLMDAAQLLETMEETYLFPHSFIGSIHEHLSFWIRQYEEYEKYKDKDSQIHKYLKQYLDEEWREQLSGYRENQRALSHYYKCLEMHNEGKAYHNMIDLMVYLKDEYNDRSDHFNIAEERHLIINEEIDNKINAIKDIYKESKLYKVDNYYS